MGPCLILLRDEKPFIPEMDTALVCDGSLNGGHVTMNFLYKAAISRQNHSNLNSIIVKKIVPEKDDMIAKDFGPTCFTA
jgi:hypothetical protein